MPPIACAPAPQSRPDRHTPSRSADSCCTPLLRALTSPCTRPIATARAPLPDGERRIAKVYCDTLSSLQPDRPIPLRDGSRPAVVSRRPLREWRSTLLPANQSPTPEYESSFRMPPRECQDCVTF